MNDDNLILRAITKQDAPFLVKWFNDMQLCKFMDDSQPDKKYDLDDICSMLNSSYPYYFVLQKGKHLIGYASLYNINNFESEFSFLIGQPSMHNKGLGTKLLSLLSDKASSLGIKKLYCWIYKNNLASIRCVQKADFIIDPDQQSLNNEFKWFKNLY